MILSLVILAVIALASVSNAFRAPVSRVTARKSMSHLSFTKHDTETEEAIGKPELVKEMEGLMTQMLKPGVLATMTMLLLPTEGAWANQYGILAGKTASLIHPTTMAALFGTSLYAGVTGLQWRKLRGLSDEIKAAQKQGPTLSSGPAKFPIADSIASINTEISALPEGDEKIAVLQKDISMLQGASALDAQIAEMTATRKRLQGAKLKDKHETTGSYLLGAGITVAVLGAFNTYMRAGKLFPGPHLYAGMAVTILWAVAASLTPAMQKGNATARSAHIALNSINVALFAWQVVSGIQITLKVWEKAPWP